MAEATTVHSAAQDAHAGGHAAGHVTTTGISNEKMAMWAFLGSECLLFGGLIATYLLYRRRPVDGTDPEEFYDIPFTSVSSFVLLMSSLTMVLAVNAANRLEWDKVQLWLLTTAGLGSTFIAGQVYEFTAFANEGLGFTTNIFGTAFYTLTGFHGVHVSIGILILLSMVTLVARGKITETNIESIEIVGLYWHFVDVVWIVIFTIVYLIP